MSTDVKGIRDLMSPLTQDLSMVTQLLSDYTSMKEARHAWEEERDEVMAFVYATDTRTTTNSKLPFKNTTTINKLSQIRTNLVVGYKEHLFPNKDWVQWTALSTEDADAMKRRAITAYVRAKAEQGNLEQEVERLLDDWVLGGLCATRTRYISKMRTERNGTKVPYFKGTVAERLDPLDVVYDVTGTTLDDTRKCVRSVFTLGALKKMVQNDPASLVTPEQFEELRDNRNAVRGALSSLKNSDFQKKQLVRAGFGDMLSYIETNTVEVLTFYGDFYDVEADELLENHKIVLVDRRMIASVEPYESWSGKENIHLSVWEFRENTLAPMGPLARIVGLQYKLDKLENLRADIFDKIANPTTVEVGDVRRHGVMGAPGFRYEVDEGGSVQYLSPPTQALNADMQINFTMQLMEDLAGAPKENIGMRTPGEKTKFEVQLLEGGQNKLFRTKIKKFEREVLTAILGDILEQGRRYLDTADLVGVFNDRFGMEEFLNITQDDLAGSGRVIAQGATIFAEKANALQTLTQLANTNLLGLTNPHWSRIKLAKAVAFLGDLEKLDLVMENIGVQEDAETQRLAQTAQKGTEAAGAVDGNITDEIAE